VREEALFLDLAGEQLFAFLHRPAAPTGRGIVLCAPLGEEMLWSRRVFVTFARELAARGYAVLRFDYRGEGDSDRWFQETSLTTRVQDTGFAIDSLRRLMPGTEDITLAGLRLGAGIAAAAATARDDVQQLVLWDPVLDGADYMQGVLRLNLMFQMALHRKVIENREQLAELLKRGETVNIEGYELGQALFEEVSAFRLGDCLPRFAGRSLLLSIPPREAPPQEALVALGAACGSATVLSANEEPFWREIKTFYQRADRLFDKTFTWLGDGK
jgi:exosortase A-associated hydrolase 2